MQNMAQPADRAQTKVLMSCRRRVADRRGGALRSRAPLWREHTGIVDVVAHTQTQPPQKVGAGCNVCGSRHCLG
eukprot:7273465-Prymnesium_polylepis.2